MLIYQLELEEAQKVGELVKHHAGESYGDHGEAFSVQMGFHAQEMPSRIREFFNRGKNDDRKHALVVRGNPVPRNLEPTPPHWRSVGAGYAGDYANLLLLYAGLLGESIGWKAQQEGRIVTDVLPIQGQEHSLMSSSSTMELGWHTEDAFSPHRADYVGLLCLRGDRAAATTISHVDLDRLPEDVATVLMEPRFRILPDSSHESSMVWDEGLSPLLGGPPDAPVLRVDRDFVSVPEGDHEARRAFKELVGHLDNNVYEIVLDPGDVCFIDNRNVVHGRRSFPARHDGTDRWLKRVNVVVDLRRTRPGRCSSATRVIG